MVEPGVKAIVEQTCLLVRMKSTIPISSDVYWIYSDSEKKNAVISVEYTGRLQGIYINNINSQVIMLITSLYYCIIVLTLYFSGSLTIHIV